MTAHAQPTITSVAARVAGLPHLSMGDLWKLWDEHFDERPAHHHRVWLETRLAYKIQERAFGGLKPSLRKKLEDIGETGLLPKQLRNDALRLLPGTILTRITRLLVERVQLHDHGLDIVWREDGWLGLGPDIGGHPLVEEQIEETLA